jgi:hypothetical protein
MLIRRSMDEILDRCDDIVELAIRSGRLGPSSPYRGWSVERFQQQRVKHTSQGKRMVP